MITQKTYCCGICKTNPDQLSHHKSHIETQKHKDKKELFALKLSKLSKDELMSAYQTDNIDDVIYEMETQICSCDDKFYKKLKNDDYNYEDNYNKDNYNLMETIINESNSISNKEALKDKIHEIHNYLRNNGAGYGMNALKVFNILYGLKKIEENNLLDKIILKRPQCEFSYLLKMANESKGEELSELIFKDVLDSISESVLRDLLFYEIPRNIKSSVFIFLLKEIDRITLIEKSCNVLLSGKIYEYFVGRDESAISELGAYFTDRHIVEYILNKLDPVINEDGTIPTMIDMFGGSGGFTTGYINFMKQKYENINWGTEINKIFHYDMNEDVIKSAGLEFFCLTGVFPDMKENLKYKNSFKDEFNMMKFKYPLTNPPYGGDKDVKSETQIKREKIKEYIKKELTTIDNDGTRIRRQKQLKNIEAIEKQEKKDREKKIVSVSSSSARIQKFAYDNKLTGKDKESCSLMLLMDIVEVGGTAIGVLKEGVFFDKKYKDLRQCLVKNYNVREVISVPQDQFENTSTKTSIIIFDNTEQKTQCVKFRELLVEKYDEDKFEEILGEIVLIQNKGDIKNLSDKLVSEATIDEILENKICSLNGKDYKLHEVYCPDRYELKKLGDILKWEPKLKHPASAGKNEGKYKFYTSSDTIKKCDFLDFSDKLCLVIGNGGKGSVFIDNTFSVSDHMFVLSNNDDNLIYYLYYYLKNNWNKIVKENFNGSTLCNISKETLNNLEIPMPKDISLIEPQLKSLETLHQQITTSTELIPQKEKTVCDLIKKLTDEGINGKDYDEYKLGDICELKSGKFNTKNMSNAGIYPFYNASVNNPIGRHDQFCFDGDKYILFIKSGGNAKNKISESHALALPILVKSKTATVSDVIQIKSKINIEYLYCFLLLKRSYIQDNAKYTTGLGHVDMDHFKKLSICVLKSHIMEQHNIQQLFDEIDELKTSLEKNKINYESQMKTLFDNFKCNEISQTNNETKEPIINIDLEELNEYIKDGMDFIAKVSKKKR